MLDINHRHENLFRMWEAHSQSSLLLTIAQLDPSSSHRKTWHHRQWLCSLPGIEQQEMSWRGHAWQIKVTSQILKEGHIKCGRRPWHPTPVFLPGKSHGWRSLVGCTLTFHFHALEKEMATHSSVLAWKIPGTEGPGGLLSMGSHRVGHDWSDLAAAAYQMYLRFLAS